jgi:hypothetical protein
MGEDRGAYRDIGGKNDGKRPMRRPTHRWGDNITMGHK